MSATSLILFAHGARDAQWALPLQRLRDAIAARHSGSVSLAFLEFMTPTLPTAIDETVVAGANAVVILPVFLAQGGHVKRDLPTMLEAARMRHPGVSIRLESAVGEAQSVIDAMAEFALRCVASDA